MSHNALVLDIFVSSPSDVGEDREQIVSAITAWNQRNGPSNKIFFNPLTWEQTVAPDRADSGQEVINEQVGSTYDIYLGVMWSRFGSATANAQSGTEDEFNQAIARHDQGETVVISFLFKNSPIPQDILDGVQYDKVQKFKKVVSEKGCLYREYSDEATLRDAIYLILDRVANGSNSVKRKKVSTSNPIAPERVAGEDGVEVDTLGLIDLHEILDAEAEVYIALMSEWGDRLTQSGEKASEATDQLNAISRLGQIEPRAAKKIINVVAEYISNMVDWGEENQEKIDKSMEHFSSAYSRLIIISEDFGDSNDDTIAAISSGRELVETVASTNKSLNELAETVMSIPRITKEMMRASKRLATLLDRIVEKNRTFGRNVEIGVGELEARVVRK